MTTSQAGSARAASIYLERVASVRQCNTAKSISYPVILSKLRLSITAVMKALPLSQLHDSIHSLRERYLMSSGCPTFTLLIRWDKITLHIPSFIDALKLPLPAFLATLATYSSGSIACAYTWEDVHLPTLPISHLLVAEHFCPWNSKAPRTWRNHWAKRDEITCGVALTVLLATFSTSADSCTKWKFLPPVSPTTRGYLKILEVRNSGVENFSRVTTYVF